MDILKDYIVIDDGIEMYGLQDVVDNWPTVPLDNIQTDDTEPLDTENWEVLKLTDEELIMTCGGDWQKPMKLTIVLNDYDGLTVSSQEECKYDDWTDGISMTNLYTMFGLEYD